MTPKKRRPSARLKQQVHNEAQTPEAVIAAWWRRLHADLNTVQDSLLNPPAEVRAAARGRKKLRLPLAWARLVASALAVPLLILRQTVQSLEKAPAEELERVDRLLAPPPAEAARRAGRPSKPSRSAP